MNGEQKAFGQELADDAATRGSHGDADGEFTLAAGGADEQQICHVGAGDEQDEADGSEEDEERRAHVADDAVAQGFDGEAFFWPHRAFRVAAAELVGGDVELGVGLGEGYAGLEASGGEEEVALVGAVGVDLEGQPDVGFGVGDEGLAEDSDDGVWLVAEREGAADDVGIASEFALPEAVADDDDFAAVGRVFLRGEGAAQHDGRAKEAEVGFADVDAVDLLGMVAGEVEAGAAEVVGGDVLKDAGLLPPVVELGGRSGGSFALGRCEQELDDAVGVGIGERLEQDGVDDGEDGGVGSDAKGQGCDGCDGEAGIFEEAAQGVLEVMPQIGQRVFLSCSGF